MNLAKIFLEDSNGVHGGPYTHPGARIYESIDGFQVDTKLTMSPTCPPRSLPSLPPLRVEHYYHTKQPRAQVPEIVFHDEKESSAYLQIVGDQDKNKMDPEICSTGSGDYTSMQSVRIRKEELQNLAAVNRLAVQTAQGFNEDNYMVFMENGTEAEQ